MQFKKDKTRNVYEQWQYKDKETGIVVYILRMPEDYINNEYFHFQISSAKSKNFKGNYSSIDELRIFSTFEDTEKAVEKWWHENIRLSNK